MIKTYLKGAKVFTALWNITSFRNFTYRLFETRLLIRAEGLKCGLLTLNGEP